MAANRPDQATHVTAAATLTEAATPTGPGADAVVVAGLRKSYGAVQAARGTSFTVQHGEIFALLGPNGAGKTTTLEILEGFRARDAGRVEVLGRIGQRTARAAGRRPARPGYRTRPPDRPSRRPSWCQPGAVRQP